MTQINLLDAIKTVQDSFMLFTDKQLEKFHQLLLSEIEERKAANNYNPSKITVADNANAPQEKGKKRVI